MLYCKKCGAQNIDGVRQCALCGAVMSLQQHAGAAIAGLPTHGQMYSRQPIPVPSSGGYSRPAQTGVYSKAKVGRPPLLIVFLVLYGIRLVIGVVAGVLAVSSGAGYFGLLIALICGSLLFTGFQLWRGDPYARSRYMRLLIITGMFSAYRLLTAATGSAEVFIYGTVPSNAAIEGLILAVCIGFTIYLNTSPVVEYCGG